MDQITLVNQSAERALQHAAALRLRMQALRSSTDPELRAHYDDLHDLVCDLVEIRNATHRLDTGVPAAD